MNIYTIKILLYILPLLLLSCSDNPASSLNHWQRICCRDDGLNQRVPLYRAQIPVYWEVKEPQPQESIADTTKPLCELFIRESSATIRIVVHSFPPMEGDKKIPPIAQINRWKGQFDEIDPTHMRLLAYSHGGFSGLCFSAQGVIKGTPMTILGWSMQLASEYDRQMSWDESFISNQKRADYTIKAVGPVSMMNKYKKEIERFAHSFELIDELPFPL